MIFLDGPAAGKVLTLRPRFLNLNQVKVLTYLEHHD